ncbi:NADH:ubiquinone oxidoreductase subunit NDUFA12 [Azospirillum sp. YIM DDC1]|uniref:NADH:ubiquinone oxidoreductase subunit NDUFA12 n=1 Tax=Azospirillum aestuarii TaxID=2802052 RepID=A0ABS1I3P8_9PROT|nr:MULTISPECIES: NADH:ubiquinone oxidoreductase subunit NDUFA12 [Azospirillum]MBK3776568.1 NADH:ubiquinone oxidoreductase subunit NDUFA12 [Azospirillum brasilense]AWJ84660.1 NADH:ubiquinone oxidoreductase subunit NDUFA12 [Azospirillum sp. TSH58]MBK4721283.1 NADH:ubiquinone oxidoreductase subunit NDUFA12 [Azospirillum aestuarii]PWC80729.1 NADH dehydrogenase [Azospirillum sp. TSH58]TWA87040.1 NADH:ubiquinone oxidoreductase subunit [Azospirillum brasilense]
MSEKISLITWMANIHIRFVTWRRGNKVGTDRFGNTYYRCPSKIAGVKERRWVIYAGEPDASKVPPEWHSWLHHTTKEPLPEGNSAFHKPWQKEHLPNLSGSLQAYRPPGHQYAGGQRVRATGDYEPWTPG